MNLQEFVHSKTGRSIEVRGPDPLGNYMAKCSSVPGCLGYGPTAIDAAESAASSIVPMINLMESQGRPLSPLDSLETSHSQVSRTIYDMSSIVA